MIAEPAVTASDGSDGNPSAPSLRRRVRRRTVAVATALVVVLGAGGYVAACAAAPLPELRPALLVPAEAQIEADPAPASALVSAEALPTAIGWAAGQGVWANDDAPRPLASITKLVTVLVGQEKAPLAPGESGATYVWTEADVQRQAELLADDGVAFPVPAGTAFSTRDMLTLMLLPSANDFAAAYAISVFGSNEAFVAAVADWAERNGIDSLTLVEPSGMDERNQASAADVARIAQLVLANPTLTEFTRMHSAEIPGIGVVKNTNPLLADPGVIGLKTGRTSDAGYNLVVAQTTDVDGRSLVKIAVTLGRPTPEARAKSSRAVLGAMESLPQPIEFVADGEKLGVVVTWTGEVVPLNAAQAAGGRLVPGESARRTLTLDMIEAGRSGRSVGSVAVESPIGAETVQIMTGAAISEPDLWWRLSHPEALFGWA